MDTDSESRAEPPRERSLDRKLRRRLWLYSGIFVVMLVVVIIDLAQGEIGIWLALIGLAGGLLIGLAVSRMFLVTWDTSTSQVTSQVDLLGAVIIGLYIVFAILRRWLFGHWLPDSVLSAFTFSVISGVMLGRAFGLEIDIQQALARREVGTEESSAERA